MSDLTEEVKQRTSGYITAGLGLVAGLAWNEAIKSLIEFLFPLSRDTLILKFIYAVAITLVVVVIGNYVNRLTQLPEK